MLGQRLNVRKMYGAENAGQRRLGMLSVDLRKRLDSQQLSSVGSRPYPAKIILVALYLLRVLRVLRAIYLRALAIGTTR